MVDGIIKRDGRTVPFELEKIASAIFRAAQATGGRDYQTAYHLAELVREVLDADASTTTPTVEHVQDVVETTLINNGHARTAKKYILYRNERTRTREMNKIGRASCRERV